MCLTILLSLHVIIAGGDWTTEGTATSQTIAGGAAAPAPVIHGGEQDWNIGPTTTTKDWADDAGEWAASEPQVCLSVCHSSKAVSFLVLK